MPRSDRRQRTSRAAAPARPRKAGVRVRPATAADLPVLVRHRRKMWEAIGRGTPAELDVHDQRYRRWVAQGLRIGRFVAYVATERDGNPLGSGAIWLVPAQPRPDPVPREFQPYILSMYTEPGARGRGVASRIVRALVAWAREHGYPRVSLHASKMGRGVYERLGFKATNEMRRVLRRSGRR